MQGTRIVSGLHTSIISLHFWDRSKWCISDHLACLQSLYNLCKISYSLIAVKKFDERGKTASSPLRFEVTKNLIIKSLTVHTTLVLRVEEGQ